MSQVAAPTTGIPQEIAARLAGLRNKLRLWLAADGLSRVLLLIALWCAATLVLDWFFRFELPWRAIFLTVGIAAVAWLAVRRLIRPLAAQPSDEALCLEVESRNADLRERVITAVEFSKTDTVGRQHASPALVRASIEQGVEAAGGVDFGNILDGPWFRLNCILVLACAALFGWMGYSISQGGPLQVWFQRNVMLASDVHWPQQIYLEVEGLAEDGSLSVLRGDDRKVFVRITDESNPEIDPDVMIDFRPTRGRPSQPMRQLPERRFEFTLSKVLEEFQFRARGADAYTPWVSVKLVEPPGVEELKIEVTPPAYAGQSPQTLPPGRGPASGLRGRGRQHPPRWAPFRAL